MKPLKLSDLNIILPFLDKADYEGYNSNFVTMMMWNHEYHIEYEIHDHFCIMLHNYKGHRFFAMPFESPNTRDALAGCSSPTAPARCGRLPDRCVRWAAA